MRLELNGGMDYVEWLIHGGGTVEITDINVSSQLRRGVGTSLINYVVNENPNKHIYAITRRANGIARSFYIACGFSCLALLPNFYYEHGVLSDAIMFGRLT